MFRNMALIGVGTGEHVQNLIVLIPSQRTILRIFEDSPQYSTCGVYRSLVLWYIRQGRSESNS